MPQVDISPLIDQNSLEDAAKRALDYDRRQQPIQTPGGPPVLPPARSDIPQMPSTPQLPMPLQQGAGGVLDATKGKTPGQIIEPGVEAVNALTQRDAMEAAARRARQLDMQRELTEHTLKSMPKFVESAHPVHPEEDAYHQAQSNRLTVPAFARAPGYHPAEQGPIGQLQRNENLSLVKVGGILTQLEKEQKDQEVQLAAREKSLKSAIGLWNAGKLSPTAEAELRRDAALQSVAVKAYQHRGQQINNYARNYIQL